MDDCIFCKIVKGDISCHKVYEDDKFLAFLTIDPISSGHTLLIPKDHYRWVYDVPNFDEYWQTAQKIALAIKNSDLKPDFISFFTMGVDVHHAHIHIIPKKDGDSVGPILPPTSHLKTSNDEFIKISSIIKNSIK